MYCHVCFESDSLLRHRSRPEWPTRQLVDFYDLIMSIIRYDKAMESSCHYKLLIEVLNLYQSTKVICNDVFDTRYVFNVEVILD